MRLKNGSIIEYGKDRRPGKG